MLIRDRRGLQTATADALKNATYCPQKIALIHSGISLGVSVLLTIVHFLLSRQIGTTSGLSGMGTRSLLTTLQTVLQLAVGIALPFWEMGFIACALGFARKDRVQVNLLTRGFFRAGPVFRLFLLESVIYFFLSVLCLNISTFLFIMTPLSSRLETLITPFISGGMPDMEAIFAQVSQAEILASVRPMLLIFCALFPVLFLPVYYSLRQSRYFVMDTPGCGAFSAVRKSLQCMRKNRWALAKVDLQFWWYYLATILLVAVGYGDVILPMFGVTLPISADVSFFLFYGIQTLGQLLLFWRKKAQVDTTYAIIYDTIK